MSLLTELGRVFETAAINISLLTERRHVRFLTSDMGFDFSFNASSSVSSVVN